jgi:L-lactate dehydrogenase complex protein LldE
MERGLPEIRENPLPLKVSLFITCMGDQLRPSVGLSMARILERLGCEVDFPQAQTCCGQPAFNSGYPQDARSSAKTLLRAFEGADYVVSPSGSCSGMVRHYFPQLFASSSKLKAKAERLASITYEFSQFLVQVLKVTDLNSSFPHKVSYHPSCHASRLLGVKDEPLQLLSKVRGLDLVPLEKAEDCCGFGGTFCVKMEDLSAAMGREKANHVQASGAEYLCSTDFGCLMQISGLMQKEGRPIQALHLAELLDQASTASKP